MKRKGLRIYRNGGFLKYQNGYFRKNGNYVHPHFKTSPDKNLNNNRKSLLGY